MGNDLIPYDTLVKLRLIVGNRRLENSRKEMGLTVVLLAEKANIKSYRLQGISNLRIIPTEKEMINIAVALEKPIDYLFPENLYKAIKEGVFNERKAELTESQVELITERHKVNLSYDGGIEAVIEEYDKKLLNEGIDYAFSKLKPREEMILRMRFGLDNGRSKTLEQVGNEINVSRERARQLEAKALRKLRMPSRRKYIERFYENDRR